MKILEVAKNELASLDRQIIAAVKEVRWQREALERAVNRRISLQAERDELAQEYKLLGGKT